MLTSGDEIAETIGRPQGPANRRSR